MLLCHIILLGQRLIPFFRLIFSIWEKDRFQDINENPGLGKWWCIWKQNSLEISELKNWTIKVFIFCPAQLSLKRRRVLTLWGMYVYITLKNWYSFIWIFLLSSFVVHIHYSAFGFTWIETQFKNTCLAHVKDFIVIFFLKHFYPIALHFSSRISSVLGTRSG